MASVPLLIRAIDPCCGYNKLKAYRVYIFFLTLITYSCYHMSRKPISVVKSQLHRNCTKVASDEGKIVVKNNKTFCDFAPFGQDNYKELLGSLDLAYLLAYAGFMFVSGHIAERVSLRYFLCGGMLLCGITTAAFGMGFYLDIHTYYYYVCVQIAGGMVQATGWPSVVACMGNWNGKAKRGFIMGVWNSHTSIGNILGALVAGAFVTSAWGLSFIVPGAIVAGMGLVVFLTFVEHPEDVDCEVESNHHQFIQSIHSAIAVDINDEESIQTSQDTLVLSRSTERKKREAVTLLGALKIPGVVEYSLCLFFAKMVSYTFLFWLPSYISEEGSFDASKSADLSAVMDAGGIIGGILAGTISDYTGASALTCVGMLGLACPFLYIYYVFGLINVYYCISLLLVLGIFVNGPYALITTAVAADLGTHPSLAGNSKALATVTAIIDGTGSLGAALGPLICSLIAPSGWQYVFDYLVGATVLAALLLTRRVFHEIKSFTYSPEPPRVAFVDEISDNDAS